MTKAAMPRTTMVNTHSGDMSGQDLPSQNPCAQCGAPIAQPDWIEPGEGRVCYLWTCHACNYRFEAIAIYDEVESPPLAA